MKISFMIGLVTATDQRTRTWVVDGNNLMYSSGVPFDREIIVEELSKCASPLDSQQEILSKVFLVFDGGADEGFQSRSFAGKHFQYLVADGKGRKKDRADDLIVEYAALQSTIGDMQVISADKELAKRIREVRKGVSFVHPPKFWKQYLPILQKKQN